MHAIFRLPFISLVITCALSSVSLAQPDTTAPVEREVDLHASDAGFLAAPSAAPILPPTLAEDAPAAYPPALIGSGKEGRVRLELLIAESGEVETVQVVESVAPELDAAAMEAARKLRFHPATQADRPVAVRLHFDYRFVAPQPPPTPTGTLSGIVRTRGSRAPIVGAILEVEGMAEVAETDGEGRFSLEAPVGTRWVRLRAPAHRDAAFRETLGEGQRLEVVYGLHPLVVNPYETIVREERERTEVSRVTLRGQELREVAGTQGDPFRVVMLMPGVASIASGLSYPVVRGAQPASTGYFIDGVRVPMLYHLLLGPAVVHPDFIDSIDFTPGVAPVRHGRLLGGSVEGRTSRPRDDRLHASAYADLINFGAFVETPIQSTDTNVTLSGRYSYTPWLLALMSRSFMPADPEGFRQQPIADFWDYQARVEQKLGNGKLRLLAFGSSDTAGTDDQNPRGMDVTLFSRFHRADLRYQRALGVGAAELGVTLGNEQVGITSQAGGEQLGDFSLRSQGVTGRGSWLAELSPRWELGVGLEVDHRQSTSTIGTGEASDFGAGDAFEQPITTATTSGLWSQLVFRPTETLQVIGGARLDHYHLSPGVNHFAFDPRLTVRKQLSRALTVKAGAALLHQPPTVLINLPVMDVAGLRHGLQEAITTEAGVEYKLESGFEFSVDGYYTRLTRAVEFTLVEVLQDRRRRGISLEDPGRRGYATGIEFLARHPIGDRWFGWVSYAFQVSRRFEQFSRYDDDERILETTQGWLPFAFEQNHVMNVALSYKLLNNLTLGTVLHFNTGRPESGEIASRTKREAVDPATGAPRWVFTDRDRVERLPPFFRVDVRIAYARTFNDVMVEAYLDMLNASISKEVLGYSYGFTSDATGLGDVSALERRAMEIPIAIPMLGVKVRY